MFKNLSKTKKILFTLFSIISFISIIWILSQDKGEVDQKIKATPVPMKFEFIKSIPSSGSISTIPVTSNVEFYFTIPVDKATADVIVTPEIPLSFTSDIENKALYIKAIPAWAMNTEYKLTVNIKSLDGQSLPSRIDYSFKLNKLIDSPMTEGYIR